MISTLVAPYLLLVTLTAPTGEEIHRYREYESKEKCNIIGKGVETDFKNDETLKHIKINWKCEPKL